MRQIDLGNSSRISVIYFFLVLTLSCTSVQTAQAEYPENPITVLCGWGAGGSTDISTRALCEATSKVLGKPVVVVNKAGSGSAVQLSYLKNQKPDGYTLGNIAGGGIMGQYVNKAAYDVNKDFTHLAVYGLYAHAVTVRSDAPWQNFKELIAHIRNNPGKLKYASPGAGSFPHMAFAALAHQQKLEVIHVPYKGDAEVMTALLGGHADFGVSSSAFISFEKSGRVRLLSTWCPERLPAYPNVPTWLDLGYNLSLSSFVGICGPKGMPKPIVDKLSMAFKTAIKDPSFEKSMKALDMAIKYRSPEETAKDVKDMSILLEKIVREMGL